MIPVLSMFLIKMNAYFVKFPLRIQADNNIIYMNSLIVLNQRIYSSCYYLLNVL